MIRNRAPHRLNRRHFITAAAAIALIGPARAGERREVNLRIRGRKVINAEQTLRFTEGDEIRLLWSSDEAVDLHLHGYDLHAKAAPGADAVIAFRATTAGRFPISAHNFGHQTLIYLEIHPR